MPNHNHDYPPGWDEPELEVCEHCSMGLMQPSPANDQYEGYFECDNCGYREYYNYIDFEC